MNLTANTVLITGGSSGIGLALAKRFLQAGSRVIICGRNQDKLKQVAKEHPQVHTYVCDVSEPQQRIDLYNWITMHFPQTNILINNAGIQRRIPIGEGPQDWEHHRQEIATNLDAPIHLSMLFIPLLKKQNTAAIINVTSGLAFVPGVFAPVYSATKAALHSFSLSLRHQLNNTSVRVVEIVPPAVNTDLGGAGLHTFGVPVNEFADAIIKRLENGELEMGYGTSEKNRLATRQEQDEIFKRMNG
jgi:uncharacterized oxidoreductase